jgi:DNA polymerase-3 subunit gamma/tau
MENFVVSARKYRPVTFDTVVGQKSITSTLKNAIKNNHLAQAFLFCGPRGVGKTTCARILAKTINCMNQTENIEACDECESCTSFNNSASFNIHELDAASNNSVEDIRNLVEQVRIPPQVGQYKVYIIDEVHMLSSAAFNAFLKTLEEPPAYAKFILATTEKHKIIPTILSRCQIFDFKRIGIDDIAKHLEFITVNENVQAETDALHIIAQKADGALRDALSIFDQIVSFSGGDITYKSVIENLNVLDYDYYFRIIDSVLARDITNCLLIINDIIDNGFDGQHFIIGMGEHLRNLMVCKDTATLRLLEVGDSIKEKYASQSTTCDINFLLEALDINNRCDIAYKSSNNKRLHIELSLMQMCSIDNSEIKKKIPTPIKLKKPEKASEITKAVEPEKIPEVNNISPKSKENITPTEISKSKYTVPSIKEEVKVDPKSRTNIPGAFSIKGFAKKEEEKKNTENKEINYSSMPKETFDFEKLEGVWNAYLNSLKFTLPGFSSALLKYKPKLKDNFVIEFQIDNKIIANDRINISELQSHLKKELNNYSLSIHPLIVEKQEQKSVYTDQDKFRKMVDKNPNVLELKQKLDLEIDF